MRTESKTLEEFLGIMTHVDATQLPFGAAVSSSNLAQYYTGKIQRIPGIVRFKTDIADGTVRIPLTRVLRGLGGGNPVVAVYKGTGTTKVINQSAAAEITGPALSSTDLGYWSHAFYANKHLLAGDGNAIQEITSATTRIAWVGTSVPLGSLIAAYLDRLYVSGIASEEGLVRYTDILGTTFAASAVVNVKELPGPVTALAINSPTSANEGVQTDLIISKAVGMWLWNEQRKIRITEAIGSKSPATFTNTPAGTFFMGIKGGTLRSVFYMPVGSTSEPRDVGIMLAGALSGLVNEEVACAVYHDGFYKLFFSRSGLTNQFELWLDVDALTEENKIIWYGVHDRGGADSVGTSDTALQISRKRDANNWVGFTESLSLSSGFMTADQVTMTATLELPLNLEPISDEKMYELTELWITAGTNVVGNELVAGLVADGVSKGANTISLYDETTAGNLVVVIPLRPPGATGMIAQSAELLLFHSMNKPMTLTAFRVQYAVYEEKASRIRGKVGK